MDNEENIKKIIEKYTKSIESLLPKIEEKTNELIDFIEKNKVDYFIKKSNNDEKYLSDFEKIVEFRLDHLMNPYTKKLFDKVIYYWGELNSKSANEYKILYDQCWEE